MQWHSNSMISHLRHPIVLGWIAQFLFLVGAYLFGIFFAGYESAEISAIKIFGLSVPLFQYGYDNISQVNGALEADRFLISSTLALSSFVLVLPIMFVCGIREHHSRSSYQMRLEVLWTLLFFAIGILSYFLHPQWLAHSSIVRWITLNSDMRLGLFFLCFAWLLLTAFIVGLTAQNICRRLKV